jgi:methylated-DNA-[protein]-cysteine S-methyltransferase
VNANELSIELARAFPGAPGDLRRLRARLAAAAERDGVLDVAYRTVDSPVGPLLLAATEAGLVRVAYASEDHDAVLQVLADRISPRVLNAPVRLDAAARELGEYFTGRPRAVRAAATACATNPLPVIVPCHRVIYSDGRIGRYLGGPDARRTLLTLEAAA